MIANRKDWNVQFQIMKKHLLSKKFDFEEVRSQILELHAFTHESLSGKDNTLEDELWEKGGDFTLCTEKNIYSVAWHLWHSSRIEDIICSHIILNSKELFYTAHYTDKLNIKYLHTGNSMDYNDMRIFNANINIQALREYRQEVAKRTQACLAATCRDTVLKKVSSESLASIARAGSVSQEDAWLLEYWGRKKIAGLITMPLTRHLLVHINSALQLV